MSQQEYHLGETFSFDDLEKIFETAKKLLGPAVMQAWNDPKTTDLYLYSHGSTRETQRVGVRCAGNQVDVAEITKINARSVFNLLSSYAGVVCNDEECDAETTLLDGTRVQFMHPPITLSPKVTMRKSTLSTATFDALLKTPAYDSEKVSFMEYCADNRFTVFFVGATGHGKTTGGKAYMNKHKKWEHKRRYIIIQDRNEVRPDLRTVEYYFVTKARLNHPGYSGAQLLKLALSDDPDILIFGELRDAITAVQHMESMNTNHNGGFTSFHANGIEDSFERYADWMVQRGVPRIGSQIAKLMPAVVFCYFDERSGEYRTQVARTTGYDEKGFKYEKIGAWEDQDSIVPAWSSPLPAIRPVA